MKRHETHHDVNGTACLLGMSHICLNKTILEKFSFADEKN